MRACKSTQPNNLHDLPSTLSKLLQKSVISRFHNATKMYICYFENKEVLLFLHSHNQLPQPLPDQKETKRQEYHIKPSAIIVTRKIQRNVKTLKQTIELLSKPCQNYRSTLEQEKKGFVHLRG